MDMRLSHTPAVRSALGVANPMEMAAIPSVVLAVVQWAARSNHRAVAMHRSEDPAAPPDVCAAAVVHGGWRKCPVTLSVRKQMDGLRQKQGA